MKKAVIVGSHGQDGRLLAGLLARRGYGLIGLARGHVCRRGLPRRGPVDIQDAKQVASLIRSVRPDQVYFLAAYHHSSQDRPTDAALVLRKSWETHVLALSHFLEAVRSFSPRTRLFYAASSRVFGSPKTAVQDERTPLAPEDAYGITKTAGIHLCRQYRRRHGLFAATGILYNHESPLREPRFISKKIVEGLLAVRAGKLARLTVGDLSAEVDWGYAPDFVDAMRRILALPKPDDFIVATGQKHSVEDFVRTAARSLGLDWRKCVRQDERLVAGSSPVLIGDYSKLRRATGWKPSVGFEGMVDALLGAARAAHS